MATEVGEDSGREARLYEIIGQFYEAVERGETPDQQEFVRQHPDMADALDEFFTEQDRFHRMVGPLRDVAGSGSFSPGIELPRIDGVEDVGLLPGSGARLIGDYELLEEIARGGMGIVYKARQRSLNRLVALKMILTSRRASRDDVLRFRNEAEAVANLDHPHIIPIYEVGEHLGRGYFAMKLVDGGSLAGRLDAFATNPRATAETMAVVARAVHHAHQRGVLHRDLKPSNILIDVDGKPYVSDFGLAKRLEEDPELTLSGAILGSPPYMAAEQAVGRKGTVTTATDVYGLGAIFYTLMTGHPPFQGDSILETIFQVKEGAPRPPSETNRAVDRELETICLKCLSKDPQRRYASALAMAEDLERWLAGEPIAARPVGRGERAWRWCRRNPAMAGAVATALTALVAVALISVVYATRVTALAKQLRHSLSESNRLLAVRNFDHGQSAFENDEIGRGLLWMVQSWRSAIEAGDPAWQHAARANLCAWQVHYPGLKGILSHPAPIEGAAFSSDGRLVITGGDDHTAQIWDPASSQRIGNPLRHEGEVIAVAFSADGKMVLTGSADHTARIWDVATGQPHSLPMRHEGRVTAVAFSPDGKTVLTGSGNTAQLWDATTGQLTSTFDWHVADICSLTFLPDGKRFLVGYLNHSARIANTKNGSWFPLLFQYAGEIRCVALSPDGKQLATGGRDQSVRLWDTATGKAVGAPLRGHRGTVRAVAFSPDGKSVLSGSTDKTARLWDTATGKAVGAPLRGHRGTVRAVAFSPDGKSVLSGSTDKTARLWDTATGKAVGPTLFHQGPVVTTAFSPDGKTLLTGSSDHTVRLWNGEHLNPPTLVPLSGNSVFAIGISPDGRTACAGTHDAYAQLWDTATYQRKGPELLHFGQVNAVAFSPDGQKMVTGSHDGAAQLWDANTGRPLLGSPLVHQDNVSAVAFHPDGKTFVTGSQDRHLRYFDTDTKSLLGKPIPQPGTVDAMAFSPDGKTLLVGYDLGTAQFWDVASRTPLEKPLSHLGAVSAAAFSPDGKTVLTGCEDGTARLWDVASRQEIIPPLAHQAWVDAVAFSPDGKTLLTGSWDGTARLWDAATGMPLGPPLSHEPGYIYSVAFSPDGRTFLTGGVNLTVRSFPTTAELPQNLPRVAAWVQVLTGLALDERQSLIRVLDNAAWLASQERLKQLGGPPKTTMPALFTRTRAPSSTPRKQRVR